MNFLAVCVEKANETATKDYLAATTKIIVAKTDTIDSIAKETTKMKTLLAGSLDNQPTSLTSAIPPFQKAKNSDDCFINGQKRQIRLYKFVKDNTLINCESSTDVLSIYTYLTTITAQYDICITPLYNVQKWIHLKTDKLPTYPFYLHNFESTDKYHAAYTTMSLALVTKLKNCVTFGIDYTSISLTIDTYDINGYEIFYSLISHFYP